MTTDNLPPHDLQAEQSILAAAMQDKFSLHAILTQVGEQSFYLGKHRIIFSAITELFAAGEPVELLTVIDKLKKQHKLEKAGGITAITSLSDNLTTTANTEALCYIIQQHYFSRECIRMGTEMAHKAKQGADDIFNVMSGFVADFISIRSNIGKKSQSIHDIAFANLALMQSLSNGEKKFSGIPSGLIELDRITGGFMGGELIIIAARPGMGKTALMLKIIHFCGVELDKPIAVNSLEMSATSLVRRMQSSEAEVANERLRRGEIHADEWKQINEATAKIAQAKILIDDRAGLNIVELRAQASRMKMEHGIEMLLVDYLQLMAGTKANQNTNDKTSEISRGLKLIAKELNIPVIALSQLSRAVEGRGGEKKPQLSDLRDSGAIEQDADMVIFPYRPEYYGIITDESGNSLRGIAQNIVAKNREGQTGEANCRFIGEFVKFEDLNIERNEPPTRRDFTEPQERQSRLKPIQDDEFKEF